ncbi:TPA: hypothetical protein ACVU3Z_002711 [Vibrio parahaemolyticus]
MIASAALNVHTPPNTRQVPTFIRSCWHGFYWHDFIVIQVKIERLPDSSAL